MSGQRVKNFFSETFSKGRRRKRPNISLDTLEQVVEKADAEADSYAPEKDADLMRECDGTQELARNPLLNAGQSKRIWGELYRVLDSADVVIQVLDARDPQGTRCRHIERYLEKEKPHKHLIFLLNKVDLQPVAVTRRWVQILQKARVPFARHPLQIFTEYLPWFTKVYIHMWRQSESPLKGTANTRLSRLHY